MSTKLFSHQYFFLLAAVLLLPGCSSFLFYPLKGHLDNPVADSYNPENISFQASDGVALHGWFLKAKGTPQGTVLVLHGNAENLTTHVNSVLWLVKEGFHVFIFDYRGYGWSEGKPTVEGVHRDAEAALKTVFALPDVDEGKVAVLGQSIGGAIAVYTVVHSPYKKKVKAVAVDSSFSSYRLIAREKLAGIFFTWPFQYPLAYLFGDHYSPVRWIPKLSQVPLLLLHGVQDRIVPPHHSDILYQAALEPKELWKSRIPGHVTSFGDEQIRREFVAFLLKAFENSVQK